MLPVKSLMIWLEPLWCCSVFWCWVFLLVQWAASLCWPWPASWQWSEHAMIGFNQIVCNPKVSHFPLTLQVHGHVIQNTPATLRIHVLSATRYLDTACWNSTAPANYPMSFTSDRCKGIPQGGGQKYGTWSHCCPASECSHIVFPATISRTNKKKPITLGSDHASKRLQELPMVNMPWVELYGHAPRATQLINVWTGDSSCIINPCIFLVCTSGLPRFGPFGTRTLRPRHLQA